MLYPYLCYNQVCYKGTTLYYSQTCLKWPLIRKTKIGFKTEYRLMQVESIAECSKGSILQYFLPSLSYHLSFRSLFCLFLSGWLRQVLLSYTWSSWWFDLVLGVMKQSYLVPHRWGVKGQLSSRRNKSPLYEAKDPFPGIFLINWWRGKLKITDKWCIKGVISFLNFLLLET